jgi:hypothetical protein
LHQQGPTGAISRARRKTAPTVGKRFKRRDLLNRVNAIIAEHFGEVLADASPA